MATEQIGAHAHAHAHQEDIIFIVMQIAWVNNAYWYLYYILLLSLLFVLVLLVFSVEENLFVFLLSGSKKTE